jgi:lipopolysaccharide cholinephosphotransferase
MNDLQKKEFDLFACFAEVCERLGLPYYLVCGSALGAVKHGGFIPWDDDMDVGMLRADS